MEIVLEHVLEVVITVLELVPVHVEVVVLETVVLNVFHRADVPVVRINVVTAKATVCPVVLVPPIQE